MSKFLFGFLVGTTALCLSLSSVNAGLPGDDDGETAEGSHPSFSSHAPVEIPEQSPVAQAPMSARDLVEAAKPQSIHPVLRLLSEEEIASVQPFEKMSRYFMKIHELVYGWFPRNPQTDTESLSLRIHLNKKENKIKDGEETLNGFREIMFLARAVSADLKKCANLFLRAAQTKRYMALGYECELWEMEALSSFKPDFLQQLTAKMNRIEEFFRPEDKNSPYQKLMNVLRELETGKKKYVKDRRDVIDEKLGKFIASLQSIEDEDRRKIFSSTLEKLNNFLTQNQDLLDFSRAYQSKLPETHPFNATRSNRKPSPKILSKPGTDTISNRFSLLVTWPTKYIHVLDQSYNFEGSSGSDESLISMIKQDSSLFDEDKKALLKLVGKEQKGEREKLASGALKDFQEILGKWVRSAIEARRAAKEGIPSTAAEARFSAQNSENAHFTNFLKSAIKILGTLIQVLDRGESTNTKVLDELRKVHTEGEDLQRAHQESSASFHEAIDYTPAYRRTHSDRERNIRKKATTLREKKSICRPSVQVAFQETVALTKQPSSSMTPISSKTSEATQVSESPTVTPMLARRSGSYRNLNELRVLPSKKPLTFPNKRKDMEELVLSSSAASPSDESP